MAIYKTLPGDVLDKICFDYYEQAGMTESVITVNPGLAAHGPLLPEGLEIFLPDLPSPNPSPDMLELFG